MTTKKKKKKATGSSVVCCYDVTAQAYKMAAYHAGGTENILLMTDSYKVKVIMYLSYGLV